MMYYIFMIIITSTNKYIYHYLNNNIIILLNIKNFIINGYDYYKEYKKFKDYYIKYVYYNKQLGRIKYYNYSEELHRTNGYAYISYYKNSEIMEQIYYLNDEEYCYNDFNELQNTVLFKIENKLKYFKCLFIMFKYFILKYLNINLL